MEFDRKNGTNVNKSIKNTFLIIIDLQRLTDCFIMSTLQSFLKGWQNETKFIKLH